MSNSESDNEDKKVVFVPRKNSSESSFTSTDDEEVLEVQEEQRGIQEKQEGVQEKQEGIQDKAAGTQEKQVPGKHEGVEAKQDGVQEKETMPMEADAGAEKTTENMSSTHSSATGQQPLPRRKRFVPKYEVEGVYKVELGEETQIQIEMVVGMHINAQYPWKTVSKSKILEVIDVGGELSDFFPIKEYIEEYEHEEMLMGFVVDESKDVDEFYICCTLESRDHCKQQSDKFIRRQEKKLEKKVQKKPRPWTCLGSDAEIIEIIPVNTRPLMEMEVRASFPTIYDPIKYKIRDTNCIRDGLIELTPYRQKFNNVFSRRVDANVQAALPKVERAAQTELRYPQNMWTQSIADAMGSYQETDGAGGDAPIEGLEFLDEDKDDSSDEDAKSKPPMDEVGLAAYKLAWKRLRRPSYIKMINNFVGSKCTEIDSILELNTVMDLYSNDYPMLVTQKSTDKKYDTMTFQEYVCFTDVRAKDKFVSCAEFHPMWTGILAISYADGNPTVMKFLGSRPDPIKRAVYGLNPVLIWSHIDSLIPKLYLESPREVKVLSFCPFNENILVGGCVNGQIVIWDLTSKLDNVEKIEVLTETRERYRIAMNAHMGWMKNVSDKAVVQSTVLSNLMTSHYGPVTAIKWWSPNFVVTNTGLPNKVENDSNSLMFFTASEDGTILIWNMSVENTTLFEAKKVKKSKRVLRRPSGLMLDVSPFKILDRNLQPCYKIILGVAGTPHTLPVQSLGMNDIPVRYSYVPKTTGRGRKYFTCEILPQGESEINTILYCGSQHGEMRRITWEGHAFNTGEVVNSEFCEAKYSCYIHDGIITCTQKNPLMNHITLTIGGKIFAIWSDELKNRPLIWKKRPYRLTDAKWSLYKPSVVFISTSEGDLEVWDLLLRSDKPISVQTLSGTMLTGVSLHTLPLAKNIMGVGDANGSFRMYLDPPIFMLESPSYLGRMESMIIRELKLMQSFMSWQQEWMTNNPHILLEMKRKEGALLAEKEEEKRKLREQEEERLEKEAEERRLQKMRVIGPEERWQQIIQKLIERTIAVKKRINRAELIEHEKPLRELEAQRLEKERRMHDIMKNQQTIFNDTVAILFPEAVIKKEKVKKSLLSSNKDILKKDFLEDYASLKKTALKIVKDNPYRASFSWDATLAEGKERRQALNTHEIFMKMHKQRIEEEGNRTEPSRPTPKTTKSIDVDTAEDDEEKSPDTES